MPRGQGAHSQHPGPWAGGRQVAKPARRDPEACGQGRTEAARDRTGSGVQEWVVPLGRGLSAKRTHPLPPIRGGNTSDSRQEVPLSMSTGYDSHSQPLAQPSSHKDRRRSGHLVGLCFP